MVEDDVLILSIHSEPKDQHCLDVLLVSTRCVAIFKKTMRIPIVIMEELQLRTEISGFDESGAVVGICEHEIDIDSALWFDGQMLSRCGACWCAT
jgi:hypothetical protein